jgi:hypothetical protein
MTLEREAKHDPEFDDAVQGLRGGDFDALAPLFSQIQPGPTSHRES